MTRGITAYGRRVGAAEHDAIRAEAFLCRKRKITEEGTITVPDGIDEEDTDEEDTIIVPVRTEWTDVQFRAEDVLREWPEGGDLATGAAPASPFEAGDEPIYRTGVAGRPSSVQLVEAEFRRRAEAGVVLPVLSDETQFLEGWLMEMHPTAPRMTAKTIANRLRKQHRAYADQRPK